jgi:hypothetical protein
METPASFAICWMLLAFRGLGIAVSSLFCYFPVNIMQRLAKEGKALKS